MEVKDLVYTIKKEESLPLGNELVTLYGRESFERLIYFKQTGKLTGDIVEIIKRISLQEEEHSFLLETILSNADIQIPKVSEEEMRDIVEQPLVEAITYDVEQERISAEAYKVAIDKASGDLKTILEHILQEEFEHIGILKKFLEEN